MKKKSKRSLLIFALILAIIIAQVPMLVYSKTNVKTNKEQDKKLCVGYYPYYGDISKFNVNNLTHLNFAFGYIYHNEDIPEGTFDPSKTNDPSLIGTIYISPELRASLNNISTLKSKNPELKNLLSLGGWGGRGFSDAALTEESRLKTAYSIKSILEKYNLDGIDIDWECPVIGGWGSIKGRPEDKKNYTLFVQTLRDVLGNDKIITLALGAGYDYRVNCEFYNLSKIVDFINVMSYGFSYNGPKYDSPLYKTSNDPKGLSIEYMMQLCEAEGVPKNKLVVGTAFFGKIPTDNNVPNYIDTDALYKLGLMSSTDYGYAYSTLKDLKNNKDIKSVWDNEAKCPYYIYIDPNTKQEKFLISYDNEKSMLYKGRFVKESDYAGAMVWEVTQDSQNELLNSLCNGLYTNFSLDKSADINGDGKVNLIDLSTISSEYNNNATSSSLSNLCNLNDDDIVDLYDLVLLSRSFSSY